METAITNFRTSFFIPAIKKLAFHITYVQILGTNHCDESRRTFSNAANHFKMCYVAVIMMREWLLVLPTKYNQNIMVV